MGEDGHSDSCIVCAQVAFESARYYIALGVADPAACVAQVCVVRHGMVVERAACTRVLCELVRRVWRVLLLLCV